MAKKQVAVIGGERCGTTVLRQFIGSTTSTFDVGEVFHFQPFDEARVDDGNFWRFLYSLSRDEADFRPPSYWPQAWNRFVSHRSREFLAPMLVFDAKFQYFPYILRNFGDHSRLFFDSPNLIKIHIRRQNTAARLVSHLVAQATGAWSVVDGTRDKEGIRRIAAIKAGSPGKPVLTEITVDPQKMLNDIREHHKREGAYIAHLRQSLSLELNYEDLFDESGAFTEEVTEKIASLTGLDAADFNRMPVMVRQRRDDFLESVINREELVEAFKGSGFEWMLEPDGRPPEDKSA